MRSVVLLVLLTLLGLSATDYYVNPTGSDVPANGTLANPWKTINYGVGRLAAGDKLHLAAGATFTENVYIGQGGTAASPKTITSDPINRARLVPPDATKHGVLIWDTAGVVVENLIITGKGMTGATMTGVTAQSDSAHYLGLTFRNLEVSGFKVGISLLGWGSTTAGFGDVVIEDSSFHHNLDSGGQTWAATIGGNSNFTVRRCQFYINPGDPAATGNSGSGFVFGGVNGGLIEYCLAHDNGGAGVATEGPCGLWAYDSSAITIQFCESYANKAQHQDGDGYDLDQNVTDSVVQYCYSHDNYGVGFLLCHAGSLTSNNNTVRYCISENDGYSGYMGGIQFYSASTGLKNFRVYGNTVFSSKSPAVWIDRMDNTSGGKIWNNIFVTTGGKAVVQGSIGTGVVQFQNNLYWSSGGAFKVAGYATLDAWRTATGQEKISDAPAGLNADPLLTAPGTGGIIGDTSRLTTLTAYTLRTGSPCADGGLDLTALFGVTAGGREFFGNPVPSGTGWAIGAHDPPVLRNRSIDMQVPSGFRWNASSPTDAQVDAPSGGVQRIRVYSQQTALVGLAPVSPG